MYVANQDYDPCYGFKIIRVGTIVRIHLNITGTLSTIHDDTGWTIGTIYTSDVLKYFGAL